MAGNRIGRINEEIQRELASLLRTVKDPRVSGRLLSVTSVETTADLRYAKVYVSSLENADRKELLKGLKSASGFLRRELGAALSLRYTPELIFSYDNAMERGAHIADILGRLDLDKGGEAQDDD